MCIVPGKREVFVVTTAHRKRSRSSRHEEEDPADDGAQGYRKEKEGD